MKKSLFIIYMLLFISKGAFAQKVIPPIIADRPDFTNSPNVLPIGFIQIESGIYYSNEKFDKYTPELKISRTGILTTLVRIGVSELFELRFGGEYLIETMALGNINANHSGLNAVMVGTKFQFLSSGKSFADAALLLDVNLPLGSSHFRPENLEPKLYFSLSHDIWGPFSATCNLGTQYQSIIEKYLNFYSLSGGIEINDKIGAFIEHYGLFRNNIFPKFFLGVGFNYLNKSNFIFDLSIGREITPETNFWLFSAGFSMRFPN